MPRIFLLACCTALLFVASLPAQSVSAKHARVELVSQSSSETAGQGLILGVHFILEQGWHIYWINPGDSGQPPALQWQLPPGFTAGDIEWPRPRKLQSSPTLADYGYSDDVLLMVPVRVPGDKFPAGKLDLGVQAKWLICREVCIPDHAELKLNLPDGRAETNPQTAALFAETEKQIPRPWPKSWIAAAESRKDDFLLTIRPGKPVSRAEFYPLEKGQIENSAMQRVKATPHGCVITLKKSDLLLKPISVLRGVLVLEGHAFQIGAAVKTQVALK
jgi:DsbC/DsbD-like thiol-disulfide interchange protein